MGNNLVGKFTQSVKRMVQEVKEDEGDLVRNDVLATNERLRSVRLRLEDSYGIAKRAIQTLHVNYDESKVSSLFQRYRKLKSMIKEVVRLEAQYWLLVDTPKQEKQEPVPTYVLRVCIALEKSQKPGEGVKTSAKLAEEEGRRRERTDRLAGLTALQIEQENIQMTNDLYRLIKKYTGLRSVIRDLKDSYDASKVFPILPRYIMLKDMTKEALRNPYYVEVCLEAKC
ncbi:hypothetical protein QYM36_000651 [Artemia franciscana]|uniref:Uncharacterized protein n=1 Tax=Artemia franciscana TaxID=6661 RepID=A0AA88IBN8_ARTSF|nr:hypothetical protein QYM36_000651 [Artemia franciscana]